METVAINAPARSASRYDVHIGEGILQGAGESIKASIDTNKLFVLTDSNVDALYGAALKSSIENAQIPYAYMCINAGESSKSHAVLLDIYEEMARANIDRHGAIIAFGGGVIGDVSGFAAATYMRGIRCVMLPTTLLSQVDSSVGGKCAVNIAAGKNLVGAFIKPSLVIADTALLASLSRREYNGGMAEVVKYGCICDEAFFNGIENDARNDEQIVHKCVSIKKRYVEEDELDNGVRRELNFGHTIGHAVEAASRYSMLHGEAVAVGMCTAAMLGEKLGVSEAGTYSRIRALLTKLSIPTETALSKDELMPWLVHDKKTDGGKVDMVLLRRVGEAVTVKLAIDDVMGALWKS